ncbi:phage tail protein [Halodesulfovibrio aestuarii]|uniref:phage tail protein n=1 Tax=Halodesulfovibrio aestuarii TaxID=126333 RepID=UPI000417FF9E
MRKLTALTSYLLQTAGITKEQVLSVADRGETIPTGRDLGHGVELGVFKYDALIQVEDFNGNSSELLLLVMGWLHDNDKDRDHAGLADPEVDASLNDDFTADVDLAIEFEEPLQIVPDEQGSILFNGRRWRVADVPIDVAEELAGMDGTANADN